MITGTRNILLRTILFLSVFALFTNSSMAAETRVNSVTMHSQMHPAVASRGDLVAVVWQSDANYFNEIICSVSSDGGTTFSQDIHIAGVEGEIHRDPVVSMGPRDEIVVVWQAVTNDIDYDVFISSSTDNGKTFSEPSRIEGKPVAGNQQFPEIAISSSGNSYIVYHDNARNPAFTDVYLIDNSNLLYSAKILFDSDESLNLWPSVAAGENAIAVVWESAGNIQFAVTGDPSGNEPFRSGGPVRPEKTELMFPRTAYSSGGFHVASVGRKRTPRPPGDNMYRHSGEDHDIYYSFVTTENATPLFSTPILINEETKGNQLRPDIIDIGGGAAAVAWFDGRETGDFNIYVAAGGPGGFSVKTRINTTEHSDSRNPRLALSGDNLVVVWQDDSEGNYDIYLSKISLADLR